LRGKRSDKRREEKRERERLTGKGAKNIQVAIVKEEGWEVVRE